mmetsp:Transcript_137103/g.273451  ORF Transcript_137103/g.273451 Transcript_137103/m.273451 type:complete len:87 (-) Transcript_137103:292-552(-)
MKWKVDPSVAAIERKDCRTAPNTLLVASRPTCPFADEGAYPATVDVNGDAIPVPKGDRCEPELWHVSPGLKPASCLSRAHGGDREL